MVATVLQFLKNAHASPSNWTHISGNLWTNNGVISKNHIRIPWYSKFNSIFTGLCKVFQIRHQPWDENTNHEDRRRRTPAMAYNFGNGLVRTASPHPAMVEVNIYGECRFEADAAAGSLQITNRFISLNGRKYQIHYNVLRHGKSSCQRLWKIFDIVRF